MGTLRNENPPTHSAVERVGVRLTIIHHSTIHHTTIYFLPYYHMPVCLSACLSVCLSVSLSVCRLCLSVCVCLMHKGPPCTFSGAAYTIPPCTCLPVCHMPVCLS